MALGVGVFAVAMVMAAYALGKATEFQMGFFVANLAFVVAGALAAGYLTGRIAGHLEIAHAAAVGIIMIVAAYAGMRQRGAVMPGPYEMTTAGCGPISAMVGAAVAMLARLRRRK